MSKNYNTRTASLKATIADIRGLNAKQIDAENINLKNKNILEYIDESVSTITHSKDTRETVYEDDLWGQWVETKDDGTVVVYDDWVANPNSSSNSAWLSNVKAVQDNKAYSEIITDDEGNFLGVDEDSVVANIQTEMIKDGSYMFSETALTSFSSNLSSLADGYHMFSNNTSITSFSNDLSNLVDGSYMFKNTSITSFSGDLSSLVNGYSMFYSTSLESFSSNLSSLVNGGGMFYNTSLTSFSGELSSLVNGSGMFSKTALTSFNCSNLSSLVNGDSMFNSTSLTSFNSNLGPLVTGDSMFYNTPLTSFNSNLSSLVNGDSMFYKSPLTSFNSNLSSLVKGSYMFSETALTLFSFNLSSLVDGYHMFSNNTSLESFSGDLSSLVDGYSMFRSSTSLASFSSDLSNLVSGSYMFYKCKLTPQSVMYIVESIRNIAEEKAKYTSGKIPWVTKNSTTGKYSTLFGFMENGKYVYTYNDPYSYTTTISASYVGQLTLGIDVTNNSETINDQLQTFAEECLYESWDKLKEAFLNKGWTVTFQYGGTTTNITLSEDEQFRGVPVYTRLIEVSEEDKDKAEYCTEDGTKFYNIDWGHDVTDYDQYQYFGSLLEACGYFGVIPVKYLEEN